MESLKLFFIQTSLFVIVILITAMSVTGCRYAASTAQSEKLSRTPMANIPAGIFIMGSTPSEREFGYRLDELIHKSSVARENRWFEIEQQSEPSVSGYIVDLYPVTNRAYQTFVIETGVIDTGKEVETPFPFVDEETWRGYGLIHPYSAVRRFLWRDGQYPEGRAEHPVVLVTHKDAERFCSWRGTKEERVLRLPTESEWEKAARGIDGRFFPWGNTFDPARLNSYDNGPFDTVPVGEYPAGISPYWLYDMAGQVFEWTSTPVTAGDLKGSFIVKGGSWDDLPGVTRSAARHGRPRDLRHILLGFRCAGDLN